MLKPVPAKDAKRITNTASFWISAVGGALAVSRKTRKAAGLLALTVGLGYLGGLWERHASMDLRRVRDIRFAELDPGQVAAHAVIGYLGYRLLRSGD